MLLQEINNQVITVRVDQEFSDLTFDFDFDDDFEDISEVPEQLRPLVQVITPIEDDYRGAGSFAPASWYENEPELAYYVAWSRANYINKIY